MEDSKSLEPYLEASPYMNYHDPQIQTIIKLLLEKNTSESERVKSAFEFVRDHIGHSYDMNGREVTRTASDVLEKKHGICYAKSHLLAAICRGMDIPAGISYQRITLYDKPEDGFCIHALNTVYLSELDKWIRLDARGNKEGINAQFSVDEEMLAFPVRPEYDEVNYRTNYVEPHPDIIEVLESHTDSLEMYKKGLPEKLEE